MIIYCYKVYFDDITPSMQKTVNRVRTQKTKNYFLNRVNDLHKPLLNKIMTTHEQRTKYNFAAPLTSFNPKKTVPALVAGILKRKFADLDTFDIKCFLLLFFPKLSMSASKLIDSS